MEEYHMSTPFTTYVGYLIKLHEMMRDGAGDTLQADDLRSDMEGIHRGLEATESELVEILSGDLYMLIDESMYAQTTLEERRVLVRELMEALGQSRWDQVIRLLKNDLGFTEEHIAFIRALAWGYYDRRVGDLFYAHHERLREQRYRADRELRGVIDSV